jgi:hypothetical protein
LSSHPLVALHFLYWSGHLSSMHFIRASDWAASKTISAKRTIKTFMLSNNYYATN